MSVRFHPILLAFACLAALFGSTGPASGQSRPRTRLWTAEQGLSTSYVNDVFQDREGFIWVATLDGLNRFDGYSFTVFRTENDNPATLSNVNVRKIAEGPDGFLWVGTAAGLNRFDPRRGTAQRIPLPDAPGNVGGGVFVNDLAVASDGTLWIATRSGLVRFDPATGASERFAPDTGLPDANVLSLAFDATGALWIGSGKGLCRMNPPDRRFVTVADPMLNQTRVWKVLPVTPDRFWVATEEGLVRFDPRADQGEMIPFKHDDPTHPTIATPRCFLLDAAQRLWFGTEGGGVGRLDPATGAVTWLRHVSNDPTTIGHDVVRSACRDRDGGLWFGTAGGLNRFDPAANDFGARRHEPWNPDSLGYDAISYVFTDKTGALWIGTDGGGADRFDPATGIFEHFTPAATDPARRLPGQRVWAIAQTPDGAVWMGGDCGGLVRVDPVTKRISTFANRPGDDRSLSGNVIYFLLVDRFGTLWIGTERTGLDRFDAATGTFTHFRHKPDDPTTIGSDTVTDLIEDGRGRMWLATAAGFDLFDPARGTARRFPPDPTRPALPSSSYTFSISSGTDGEPYFCTRGGLCVFDTARDEFRVFRNGAPAGFVGEQALCVTESPPGMAWVGTEAGLNRIDMKTGAVTAFTPRDGLPVSRVVNALTDGAGILWIGTSAGLCRFDPKTRDCQVFDARDGLSSSDQGRVFAKFGDNRFVVGMGKGLNMFSPAEIRPNPNPPPVVITGFRKFDRPVTDFDGKTVAPLGHDENFISFEFAALNYTLPEKNRYAYKLDGFDRDWVQCGTRRYASYTNLDPGEYVFRVQGANNSGLWNETGVTIRFRVLPPWWRTWWAYAGYAVLTGLAVFGAFSLQNFRLRERERLRAARGRAELAEEQARVAEALAEVKARDAEISRLRSVELAEANKTITDSLLYAQAIQLAIFPTAEALNRAFSDFFILYRPKDIVSGDFYWFYETGDEWFFAVADCTGHGVPGAFMSMIGNDLLNQIVIERGVRRPAEILDGLHAGVRTALKQGTETETGIGQDGMDIVLCRFEPNARRVTFAGAGRPLYIVDDAGTFTEYKGDRRAIGGGRAGRPVAPFQETAFEIGAQMTLYFSTDGFADQPGAGGKKFGSGGLRQFLQDIAGLSCAEQEARLAAELARHAGDEAQRDDITVIGVRIDPQL